MTIAPSFFRSFILSTAMLASLGFVTNTAAQERSYLVDLSSKTVTELGNLGGAWTSANAINDSGQVTGSSETTGGASHAFITGPDGAGMRDLGTLGGISSWGSGINDVGQVAGSFRTNTPYDEDNSSRLDPFITGPDGVGMKELSTVVEGSGVAYAVNDAGQVAGASYGKRHSIAFVTGPGGLGVRHPMEYDSAAIDINNAGQVAGHSSEWMTDENPRAFIANSDEVGGRDLDTLGSGSWASGINDAGQVVGWSKVPAGDYHAFITGPDGLGIKDLGTLGGKYSVALGINDAGQVVGKSSTLSNTPHAFITNPDGESMADLNSLVDLPDGVVLTSAVGINNAGQIIAMGVIPEPEAYAMLLAGLGLIGFMVRRKKMASAKTYPGNEHLCS